MSYNYEFLDIVEKTKVPKAYKMGTINIKLAELLDVHQI